MSEEVTAPQKGAIRETLESIDHYWFGYGSPTALGLFRIVIGFLTVVNLLMLSVDWETWFSERGLVPAWLGSRFVGARDDIGFGTHISVPVINLLSGTTDDRISLAFYIATIVAGILTTFGLWTRASSILLALGVITLQHRNAAILHGGDSVVRLGCIYTALAPTGAACSIDRLVGLWNGRIFPQVSISVWPQRLIVANVALIYLTTTWLKWGGGAWKDGTATFYASHLGEFKRFPVPQFMTEVPFVYFTTYLTLLTEFSMATLVFFRPLRKYVLIAGIFMHGYVEYSMNIPLFSYLMVSTYICFYDGEEITAWAIRVGHRLRRFQVTIQLPAATTLKPNAAAFLDAIDPFKLINYHPGKTPEWTAIKSDGTTVPVTKALRSRCIGSWFFSWYPGIWNRILSQSIEAEAPRLF